MKKLNGESKIARAPNFCALEKDVLVDLVSKYKNHLENNKTDGASAQEKKEAWIKLSDEFNSTPNVNKRTATNLRTAYENLKKKPKKTVAYDKVRTHKTGGGVSPSKVTSCDRKVMALLGPRIIPLRNKFDSDATYNQEDEGSIQTGTFLKNFTEAEAFTQDEMDEIEMSQDQNSPSIPQATVSNVVALVCTNPSPGPSNAGLIAKTLTPTRAWKSCWQSRRRPNLNNAGKNKKKSTMDEVFDMASSKKRYYDRLLEMAEEEHGAKLEMIRAKTNYYINKGRSSII